MLRELNRRTNEQKGKRPVRHIDKHKDTQTDRCPAEQTTIDRVMKHNRNSYYVLTCETVQSYNKSAEKPSVLITVDTEKK